MGINMKKTMWNRIFLNFLNGIAILTPVAITVAIVRFGVIKLNDIILDPLLKLIDPDIAAEQRMFLARTIIFLGVIFVVSFIGWGAKILVVNRFFSFGEKLLLKVPIFGRMYKSIKQISSAFIGQGKTIFKQVVLVEYPRKGIYSLGFTTGVSKGEIKDAMGKSTINVFLPTTPNPTSGYFLVIPKDEIRFLKMSVEEGMKLVVSGGSVTPHFESKDAETNAAE
jgi:uncharacterized membrane protein